MTLPTRHRLALVSAALVAALIVVLGAVLYLRLEADLLAAVDDELLTRAETLVDEGGEPVLAISPTDVGDVFAQRADRNGRVIATSPGLAAGALLPVGDLATLDGARMVEAVVVTPEEPVPVRLLAMPARDGTVVIVGVTIDDQRAALATLLQQLAVALPGAVILAAGVGWLVAGAALRPVERIRKEAEAISGSEPDRRLPVPATRDELTALGLSLNRMLDRLQEAVERERRFVDDASHELRTPLANLKAELDLALRRSRTEAELVAALRSAAEETDRLSRLAEDLLVLARSNVGGLPIRREEIDVARLVAETVASFSGRAASLGVRLETETVGDATAAVDPVRVRQAVGNLLDNGIRHAPPGGRVSVTLVREATAIAITVSDSGAGFPSSFLRDAFLPFTRADTARSRSAGGAGLGLAIVRAVVEAHGGTALAGNGQDGGGEVVLRLPA
jgi:heavy metal sensor kinase